MKWSAINSADLRLEQGCHEERVLSELNRFDARIISPGADREPVISETADICRRDSEVAPMKAHEGRAAAERGMHRTLSIGVEATVLYGW